MNALLAGLAGAAALTAVHQFAQRRLPDAPRMDVLGMRAMARVRRAAGMDVPDRDALFRQTLAGDLVSNAIYYSLVGMGGRRRRWTRGAALGLAAGLGALALPRPLGLGDPPHVESLRNRVLTVAWYTIGGLAAAATVDALDGRA